VTLAGPAAGNYTLVYSGTVTINPYPITVAATAASKTYDGTTTASGSATVTPSGGTLIGGIPTVRLRRPVVLFAERGGGQCGDVPAPSRQ